MSKVQSRQFLESNAAPLYIPVKRGKEVDLPPVIFKMMFLVFSAIIGVLTLLFWNSPVALFMVVISGFYFIMYGGLPMVMARNKPHLMEDRKMTFKQALNSKVGTYTGPISGTQAMIQVLTVPVALLVCFIGISIIIWMKMNAF